MGLIESQIYLVICTRRRKLLLLLPRKINQPNAAETW